MFYLGGGGKKRLPTVLVEAKYDGQTWQEAKIGRLCFTLVVEEAKDFTQSWWEPNMMDSLVHRKPELADYVLP